MLASCSGSLRYASGMNQRVGRVYMFRGVIGLLCLGVDQFDRDLRAEGFCAGAYENIESDFVVSQIEQDWKNKPHEPLILIGYSSGADGVLAIARRLNREHIPIDLMVTIDPMVAVSVPPNVRVCENYYEIFISALPAFGGRPLPASPPVQLTNIHVTSKYLGEGMLNHFNMDEQPRVKAEIIAHLKKLCPVRGERPAFVPPTKAR